MSPGNGGLPVEVVRELSMLQLPNGAHPNVMRMVDASLIESEVVPTFVSAGGALTRAILGPVHVTQRLDDKQAAAQGRAGPS